jgi:hypothetical protein
MLGRCLEGVVQLEIRNRCSGSPDPKTTPEVQGIEQRCQWDRSSSSLNQFLLRQSGSSLLVSVAQHFVIREQLTTALPSLLWVRRPSEHFRAALTDNRGNRSQRRYLGAFCSAPSNEHDELSSIYGVA